MTRFQNGFQWNGTADTGGRVFCKYMAEFLTKVVGWPVVDKLVAANGRGDSLSIAAGVVTLTDAAAPFVSGDVGKSITIAGATNLGNNGTFAVTTYTSTTQIKFNNASGVNETSSFGWYMPRDISGVGDSLAVAAGVVTLTDAAAPFQSGDVGRSITIAGATNPGNNGTFTVTTYVGTTQIRFNNGSGLNETSSFRWQLPREQWDGYVAQGIVAETTGADTIDITSPAYAITSSNVNSFLTITGFAPPYQERDGIYKISSFLGTAGSVYSVKVHKYSGPHSDGVPIGHTGLSWRLWSPSSNIPDQGDTLVVAGTGRTGSGLNIGSSDGYKLSMSGSTVTLDSYDGYANWQTSDVGKSITISGAAIPANNGTFTIAARLGPTRIQWVNAGGIDEESNFSWDVTWQYHLRIKSYVSGGAGFPELDLGPWGTWSSSEHRWTDSRFTTLTISYDNTDWVTVYAEADAYHFIMYSIVERGDSVWSVPQLFCVDELISFHPAQDPRPVVILNLWASQNARPRIAFGAGASDSAYTCQGLSYNETTTLGYYLNFWHSPTVPLGGVPALVDNWTWLNKRARSKWSDKIWRIPIFLESRTSGHMELRGRFTHLWMCCPGNRDWFIWGTNREWLSPQFGLAMPWNGAVNWFSRAVASGGNSLG